MQKVCIMLIEDCHCHGVYACPEQIVKMTRVDCISSTHLDKICHMTFSLNEQDMLSNSDCLRRLRNYLLNFSNAPAFVSSSSGIGGRLQGSGPPPNPELPSGVHAKRKNAVRILL